MGGTLSDQAREVLVTELADKKNNAAVKLADLGDALRRADLQVTDFAADWVARRMERLSDSIASADAADVADKARVLVKKHPLMLVSGAVGAGYLLGRLVRRSKS